MKDKIKTPLVIIASLLAGAGVSYLLLRAPASENEKREKPLSVVKTSLKGDVRKITEISLVKDEGKTAVRIVESEMARPGVNAQVFEDTISEEDLSEAQKQVLAELEDAIERNDLRKARKVLSKLIAKISRDGWSSVPVCLRSKAVEAISGFGKAAAIDLIPFVGDPNEDVSSEAFREFELSLQDCDMGDFERATIVKAALQAISDTEQIESLLTQLDDMRNSRKVATISDILENGSEQAKKMMLEQISDYTDEDVKTKADLKKWLAENPDDEGDPELYGGAKAE